MLSGGAGRSAGPFCDVRAFVIRVASVYCVGRRDVL